ncbi:thiopeptide-type bacteriocin biosynthesis protein [Kitasatospora sp. NBC_01287]|uniref:thiopeptide-type bacteriocin biosynthesis protein n=1 Tax=Kitasatospora sp. NBC_01287 TaxID=2903573 RepID=UPI0022596086|nr:thiopeptide-type bacteriocin biosynthesis protein [Kitasatospora sp. NBC_01287]MCX4745877.1 thiopeptide-type bacteriocin biosynthesis protein [Kitasatospora sp. NBC_01287]
MTTTAPATTDLAGWHSLHLFLHCGTEETDAFLVRQLAPLLDGLVRDGRADRWFFIRYQEGGPHLRIRIRGLAADTATELPGLLAQLAEQAEPHHPAPPNTVPAEPGWASRHAEVRPVPYRPETERYGGARALPIAEEVFAASSRVALSALAALVPQPPGANTGTGTGTGTAQRLTLAADLAQTTAEALGLDRLAAAQWLRRHAGGWRWVTEVALLPAAAVHSKVNRVHAGQHQALLARSEAVRAGLRDGTAAPWLTDWAAVVREADTRLREAATIRTGEAGGSGAPAGAEAPVPADLRLPWVWASQLHMLLNRLGVAPDEERAVCRLAARTLLDTGEPPSFFPTGHTAVDRQYLERSKFQVGRDEDTTLGPLPAGGAASPPAPFDLPEIELPGDPLPDLPLRQVLRRRVSARGPLAGPLTATTLGTLLWNAHAPSHESSWTATDGTVHRSLHRPYPSAGALYTARLRLLALDVAGLAPGTYDCLPERRALRLLGPAPAVDELKALSGYFARPDDDLQRIGIERVPAVLALYLDLGRLRGRYGLRALRLGLLECGHLAQTVVLTATALGLVTTTVGGLQDDLAHELLGLDDLDQPLQYLLPLGRTPGAA